MICSSACPDAGPPYAGVPDSGSYDSGVSAAAGLCTPDGWCWDNPTPLGTQWNAIWVASDDEAWAVGESGQTYHYLQGQWTLIPSGTGAVLCVKPDQAEPAARVAGACGVTRLLSIVAGMSTSRLEAVMAQPLPVVRAWQSPASSPCAPS